MLKKETKLIKKAIELLNILNIIKLTKKQNDIKAKFAGINKKPWGITISKAAGFKLLL